MDEDINEGTIAAAQEEIVNFLRWCADRQYDVTALGIDREFKIRNKDFAEHVYGSGPGSAKTRDRVLNMAAAIRIDRKAVAERLSNARSAVSNESTASITQDSELLIREALRVADEPDTEDALSLARRAFVLAWRNNPESGMRMLPRMLYVGHRYARLTQLLQTIERIVIPAIDEIRKPISIPPVSRASAQAMVACILNEGGAGREAGDLFELGKLRELYERWGEYDWLPTMLMRNEAHYWAWHPRAGGRAQDWAEEAERRDVTRGKALSVANTYCETLMALGQIRLAWEHIEESYLRTRDELEAQYLQPITESVNMKRFHHSYAAFVFGVLSRARLGSAYSADDLERDLNLANRVLGVDRAGRPQRAIRIGHRPNMPIDHPHNELNHGVKWLVKVSERETLSDTQTRTLTAMLDRLTRG